MRVIAALLALSCVLLCLSAPALAVDEASVHPPNWPSDRSFEYGIYDQAGRRLATAYYRILHETHADGPAYRLKYTGENSAMREASEVVVLRDTLRPLQSTRKVVEGSATYFQDVTYRSGTITVRSKRGSETPTEVQLPAQGGFFDYEELLWLVPQLNFENATQLRFNLFDTINEVPTTVIITSAGSGEVSVQNVTYPCRTYTFDVSTTPYKFWVVMQDGVAVPARIDMGKFSFVNLKLSAGKVGPFPHPQAEEPPDTLSGS